VVIDTPNLSKATTDYRKALADQVLAGRALRRVQDLWERHARAERDLKQADNDTQKGRWTCR
jgi:hypothetical protein